LKKRALPVVILRSANNGFRAGLVLNTDQTGFKKSRGSERFQKNKQQTLLIMQRQTNTDASGQPFSPELVEAVWQKARTMGVHETLRVDAWGWTIVRSDYGNNRSRYGWEIDHILPVSQGGGDELTNLQPLQWENNRRKDEMMQGVIGSTRPDAQARQPRATKQPRRK
jgi:5-methylcytosine-specific restriction endonuclease McrA